MAAQPKEGGALTAPWQWAEGSVTQTIPMKAKTFEVV